ncbi:MAG: IPT/TIG domain-containing protein [Myxococcota bacterium]
MLLLLACAWRSEPCPEIEGVTEEGASEAAPLYLAEAHRLVVTGDGFSALPTDGDDVLLPGVEVGGVALVDLTWSPEALTGTLEADALAPGLHDLVVTNPAGCAATLEDAVEIVDVPGPTLDESIRVDDVTPPFGWTGAETAVTISGDGFESTPRVFLSAGAFTTADPELAQVAFITAGSLTAVVPAGLPVGGPHDVVVLNPDNGYNVLEDAFTVTEEPPPDVLDVLPQAGTTQEDTPVAITGESFDAGATISLVGVDGSEVAAVATVVDEGTIDATVPSSAMGVGQYLVRVTNPDGSYDDWAAFVVRNPSAKLGTAGAWAAGPAMATARTGLGLLSGVDALGRGWLWAVGGDDGTAPLASVERAQVDAFGAISGWQTLSTAMTTPRADASYVVLGGFVWAIGGDDGTGALDTVERAAILDGEAGVRPEITEVGVGPGGLAAGAWYYRVSAVMGADDPWNPGGETLASEVEVVRVDTDAAITLTWTAIEGASSYRVYRTDAVDGAAGAEHRVAADVAETTWTDDGVAPGTESYVPDGALGAWVELEERLPAPRSHAAAVVVGDTVWLVGGTADGATPEATVWACGADGVWLEAGTMLEPRMDHGAFAVGFDEASALGEGSPTYLVAMQGDAGDGATETIEYAVVGEGGALGAFEPLSNTDAGGQARVDLVGLAGAGWMYALGGGGDVDEAEDSGRQAEIEGPALEMGSWSSTSDSGTFGVPRADFGLAPLRATLYAAGGRTDGDAATSSVEQVVF